MKIRLGVRSNASGDCIAVEMKARLPLLSGDEVGGSDEPGSHSERVPAGKDIHPAKVFQGPDKSRLVKLI
jgi:hypothetical protein